GEKRPKSSWELDDIQKLIDLVVERGIDEFELERNGLRIRIKRGGGITSAGSALQGVPSSGIYVSPPATQAFPAGSSLETPSAPARVQTSEEESTEELHIVKSPIVGTFYNTPAPN